MATRETGTTATRRERLLQTARRGIERCRRGDWEEGVADLNLVATSHTQGQRLPLLVDSYLGFGMASLEGKHNEGLSMCLQAVAAEFWEPDNYLNLARLYLLLKQRKLAVKALEQGLEVHPEDENLLALRKKFGLRQAAALSFLPRAHPVNRFFGRLRHALGVANSTRATDGGLELEVRARVPPRAVSERQKSHDQ